MNDYQLMLDYEGLPAGPVRECVGEYLRKPAVQRRLRRAEAGRHCIKLHVRGSNPTEAVRATAAAFNLSESTVWEIYSGRKRY